MLVADLFDVGGALAPPSPPPMTVVRQCSTVVTSVPTRNAGLSVGTRAATCLSSRTHGVGRLDASRHNGRDKPSGDAEDDGTG